MADWDKTQNGGLVLMFFAVTAPGLEALCAGELQSLGIAPAPEAQDGGVAWTGGPGSLYRANLELRTASRVIARVGGFRARTFAELERRTARLPWRDFIVPGTAVRLRVTSRKSKLYHSDAVAERVMRVVAAEAGAQDGGVVRQDEEADVATAQLVVIRLLRDEVLVSVDASGALLHQRGYRQAIAKAPVRETLAAAMLLAAGWRGDRPLVDPMCGSGTIPIEAALLARRIPPGLARPGYAPRDFAFRQWPGFDEALWSDVVTSARAAIRGHAGVPILGSDRNAGAITAATSNAARAGVSEDLSLEVRPLSRLQLPPGPGAVVLNPPYGVRVGGDAALRPLYVELGHVLRAGAPGWTLAMLSADPRLESATGIALQEQLRTSNGGIPVRIVAGTVPGAGQAGVRADAQSRAGGPAGGSGV
jgi:putative N6-adenine-specific DNA methylase